MDTDDLRPATPGDYDEIARVASDWWGRDVLAGLPRLFLDHFYATSLIAADDGAMTGFLVGLVSPGTPGEAYIHYVAVHPARRGRGLARRLYDEFGEQARLRGCRAVRAITSPGNETSIAFHRHMGFDVRGPVRDYNGPGRDMMVFTRSL